MGARFTEHVALIRKGEVQVSKFAPGDEVPSWAAPMLGSHVYLEDPPRRAGRPRKSETDEDGTD